MATTALLAHPRKQISTKTHSTTVYSIVCKQQNNNNNNNNNNTHTHTPVLVNLGIRRAHLSQTINLHTR